MLTLLFVTHCVGLALRAEAQDDGPQADEPFFSLPVELEFDGGASNGDAAFLKLAPLYRIPINDKWSLVNVDLLSIIDAPGGIPGRPGNPNPEKGGRSYGLGDLSHLSFFTPTDTGNFIYSFGFLATLPIASDSTLGSEKWSAGPALRVVYRSGPWNLGLLGGNQWSFAGDNLRGDVNQLMLRGAFRRQLDNDWFLISAPVITANWKAKKSSDTWMLPLGGGIGKLVNFDSKPWFISAQAYANVVKPDGGPDWMIRFAVVAPVPMEFLAPR